MFISWLSHKKIYHNFDFEIWNCIKSENSKIQKVARIGSYSRATGSFRADFHLNHSGL